MRRLSSVPRAHACACACACALIALISNSASAHEASDSRALVNDGPQATTVQINAVQPTLTLGADTGTTLQVTVTGPLAAVAVPARTQATVGVIGPLVPAAIPGTFTADYRVPADRVPQSAIISAEVSLPGGARVHGVTRLTLPAATKFPLRTSPNASVSLEIAGRVFGPKKADATGNVSIPIVVPPQAAVGRARAVNSFGIANETEVDLQPRDYPRVLLVAPPDGEVGATVDVEVWAVEPTGEPSPSEEIDLRASAGTVRRTGGMPGLARFAFTLPVQLGTGEGPGAVALVAAMDDGTSIRPDAVIVRAGPASQIVIGSDMRHLVVATPSVAHLTIVAQDRFGNPVPARGMIVLADGERLPTQPTPTGASAEIAAPTSWLGRDHVDIRAVLGELQGMATLPVTGGVPARARLGSSRSVVDGDGQTPVDFVLEIFDERGTPTSASRVTWQTDEDGAVDPLPSPRFGVYAVRFVPRRALRDHLAIVTAVVDTGLGAKAQVVVEAGALRTAAARVGVAANLGSAFGQTAFIEATLPLRRFKRLGRLGRLLSAGVALGYVHSEVTSGAAPAYPGGIHLDVNQAPVLAVGRIRMPGRLAVELSLSGAAGITFASTEIKANAESQFGATRGTARALVIGGGADATVLLQPGELTIGARYLYADLGRSSDGDRIDGNTLGFICDLGFRLGF